MTKMTRIRNRRVEIVLNYFNTVEFTPMAEPPNNSMPHAYNKDLFIRVEQYKSLTQEGWRFEVNYSKEPEFRGRNKYFCVKTLPQPMREVVNNLWASGKVMGIIQNSRDTYRTHHSYGTPVEHGMTRQWLYLVTKPLL